MRIIFAISVMAGLLVAAPAVAQSAQQAAAGNEVLTNESVIQLVQVGLGDEAVIAKIRASKTNFSLATNDLIQLKSRGVSGPVIAAMLGGPSASAAQELSNESLDPKTPHYPGMYIVKPEKMLRIQPTISNQAKTGGIIGYALTGGLATMSVKAAIPGDSAKIQSRGGRPVFYAYFDESVPRGLQSGNSSTWANGLGTVTSSPAEMTLVRFVEKKDRREARVGSVNIAGAKTGVMDKDQIAFEAEMVAPGIYRIEMHGVLPPGEYGFIQSMSGGGNQGAMTARVFDFGVF